MAEPSPKSVIQGKLANFLSLSENNKKDTHPIVMYVRAWEIWQDTETQSVWIPPALPLLE